MARVFGQLSTSADVSTGTSPKTILQITAPSGRPIAVQRITLGLRGNSPTADKVLVQVIRSATGGTATNRNPAKIDNTDATTIVSSGKENFTAEPTGGTVIYENAIHPQGSLELTEEIKIAGGETLGIVTNAPAAVNARARIKFEE